MFQEIIQANKEFSKRELVRRIAFNYEELTGGESLFPHNCIDILEEVYGKRLDSMTPSTISSIVYEMIQSQGDANIEDINEAVQDFCNCF